MKTSEKLQAAYNSITDVMFESNPDLKLIKQAIEETKELETYKQGFVLHTDHSKRKAIQVLVDDQLMTFLKPQAGYEPKSDSDVVMLIEDAHGETRVVLNDMNNVLDSWKWLQDYPVDDGYNKAWSILQTVLPYLNDETPDRRSAEQSFKETVRQIKKDQSILHAVKYVKEVKRWHLKECKVFVDNLEADKTYQERVNEWMLQCFGDKTAKDILERSHRFLEEALELAQACGCTASHAQELLCYVFGRPDGEFRQEAGAVMVTLSALCSATEIDMVEAGEDELKRIWGKIEEKRIKFLSKKQGSALPGNVRAYNMPSSYSIKPCPDCGDFGRIDTDDHGGWTTCPCHLPQLEVKEDEPVRETAVR